MKLRTPLTIALSLLLSGLSLAQPVPPPAPPPPPPGGDLSIYHPQLPEQLDNKLRMAILEDLEHSLGKSFSGSLKIHASQISNTLLMQGPQNSREEATRLAEKLLRSSLQNLDHFRDEVLGKRPPMEKRGSLELGVEILLASRSPGSEHPLPEAIEKSLSAKLGFQGFQSVGRAALKAVVGTESELKTLIPYGEGRSLEVRLNLVPMNKPDLLLQARFEVIQLGGQKGEIPIRTNLQTTYRPQVGKPTLIGASPLSGETSLLFLVSHSGEALEGIAKP